MDKKNANASNPSRQPVTASAAVNFSLWRRIINQALTLSLRILDIVRRA